MTSLLIDILTPTPSPSPYELPPDDDQVEVNLKLIELEDEFEYFDYLTDDPPPLGHRSTRTASRHGRTSSRGGSRIGDSIQQHIRDVERSTAAHAHATSGVVFRGRCPTRRGRGGGPPPPPPPRSQPQPTWPAPPPPPYSPLPTASDRPAVGLDPFATPFHPLRQAVEPEVAFDTSNADLKQPTVYHLNPADYADSIIPCSSFEVKQLFNHTYKACPFPLEKLQGDEELKPLRHNLLPEEREGLDDFQVAITQPGLIDILDGHQRLEDVQPATFDKYYQDDNVDAGDDYADVDFALWSSTPRLPLEKLVDLEMSNPSWAKGPSAYPPVTDDEYPQIPDGLDSDDEDLWLFEHGMVPLDRTSEELKQSLARARARSSREAPPAGRLGPSYESSLSPAQPSRPVDVARNQYGSTLRASPAPRERVATTGIAILSPAGHSRYSGRPDGAAQTGRTISPPNPAFPANRIQPPYEVLLHSPSLVDPLPKHLNPRNDPFQRDILQSWSTAQRSRPDAKIKALLDRMTYIVNVRLGGPNATTEPGERRFEVDVFGSVSWGGQTGTGGDLDLVIRDRHLLQGYHPSLWRVHPHESSTGTMDSGRKTLPLIRGLPDVYDLHKLARVLRSAGARDVRAIPGATCPIIKFYDEGFNCDININDLGGWYNSRLILAYCDISPYVLRPLIHVLKLWASAKQVNDPSGASGPQSMSSYCLTLMAIGYLQHLGALPNLQANINVPIPSLPWDTSDPDLIWVGWGKSQGIPVHIGFATKAPPGWRPRNPDLTASEAVKGFFAFFSRSHGPVGERFNFVTQIVSILNGGIISRVEELGERAKTAQQAHMSGRTLEDESREARAAAETRMGTGVNYQPRNWGDRRLIVQDPFIWQKNCTQAMSKSGLDRWWEAIDFSSGSIRASGPRLSLPQLLTPHVPLPARPGTPRGFRGGRGSPMSYGSRSSRGSSRGLWSAR